MASSAALLPARGWVHGPVERDALVLPVRSSVVCVCLCAASCVWMGPWPS